MDVYKAKIQSDESLDKLKLRIVVREHLQNKEIIGDTWSPTASMRTLKYFIANTAKHKERVLGIQVRNPMLRGSLRGVLIKTHICSNGKSI